MTETGSTTMDGRSWRKKEVVWKEMKWWKWVFRHDLMTPCDSVNVPAAKREAAEKEKHSKVQL